MDPERAAKKRKLAEGSRHPLLLWIEAEHGIQNERIDVRESTCGGNGVFLTASVAVNDIVLSVPLSLLITEHIAVTSEVGDAVKEFAGDNVPDRIILILYLMAEKARGTGARLFEYISSLPDKYSTPTYIAQSGNVSVLDRLSGTAVGDREASRGEEMKQTYNVLFPRLSLTYPDIFPRSSFSWETYLWAHTTVATRLFPPTFSIPNNENAEQFPSKHGAQKEGLVPSGCLIPCADMLNHKSGTRLAWRTDGTCLHAHATTKMGAGEEVTFSYGDEKSNGHLLVTYGFCVPFNPNDVSPITFPSDTIDSKILSYAADRGLPAYLASCKRAESPFHSRGVGGNITEFQASLLLSSARVYSGASNDFLERNQDAFSSWVLRGLKNMECQESLSYEMLALDFLKKHLKQQIETISHGGKHFGMFHAMEADAAASGGSPEYDSVAWYLYGQFETLQHTLDLVEVYEFSLLRRGCSQQLSSLADDTPKNERHEQYMKLALLQAQHALETDEVPVGCVFVRDDKIVATGYNKTNVTCNATRHAELVAFDKAFVSTGRSPRALERCDLYVTVEPCIMCASALARLGIRNVYFGCKNDKFGGNGSILSLHQNTGAGVPIDDSSDLQAYGVHAGTLKDMAVAILQSFYERGNPKAPKPHRKIIGELA
jgi:tRNA-specific adenosine deaminase 2